MMTKESSTRKYKMGCKDNYTQTTKYILLETKEIPARSLSMIPHCLEKIGKHF